MFEFNYLSKSINFHFIKLKAKKLNFLISNNLKLNEIKLGKKLLNNLLEVYSQIFSLIFLHFQTLILLYFVLLIIINDLENITSVILYIYIYLAHIYMSTAYIPHTYI